MVAQADIQYSQKTLASYYEEVQSPLFIGLDGTTFTQKEKDLFDTVHPSGVVLLGKNISNPDQTTRLIYDIHNYAKNRGIKISVAIDEEIGAITRLSDLSNYPATSHTPTDLTKNDITRVSLYLRTLGIDIDLAPVADIAYSKSSFMVGRSLGSTPQSVSTKLIPYIQILEDNNVQATLKHFPGHGRTLTDSHLSTPTISIAYEDWIKSDAVPFRETIKQANINYIMFGHILNPKVDAQNLAPYSSKWVNILYENLGYEGFTMTDDLKMAGAQSGVKTISQAISKSLDAGITYPMIILDEQSTKSVFNDFIKIAKSKN